MASDLKQSTHREFGSQAESAAAAYLERKGWTILKKNYHTRRGEIDIVGRDREFLVFIEVKSTKVHNGWETVERINRQKQKKIQLAATEYISRHEIPAGGIRFDAILMTATNRGEWLIDHIRDAFRIDNNE